MKFSIIIPIYNAEKYVDECLQNILGQTYSDFEVICVNDASTDGSANILEKYEHMDSRVKIICEKTNCGTSKARKDGVLKSKGEYILFVDADDLLMKDACERLDKITQEKSADIIHFRVLVKGCDGMDDATVDFMKKYLQPYIGKREIADIRKASFEKEKISHTLWGKLYDGDVCRKAFSYISDERYVMTEDLYAFFAIAELSSSYIGIEDELYQYNYGLGITGENKTPIELFDIQCSRAKIIIACEELAYKLGGDAIFYAQKIRKYLISACAAYIVQNADVLKVYPEEDILQVLLKNLSKRDISYIIFYLAELINKSNKRLREKRWMFPYEKVKKNSRVVLYGAGKVGQDYFEQIQKTGFCELVAWVDETKAKSVQNGVTIEAPQKVLDLEYDYVLIAVRNKAVQQEIKELMIKFSVDENAIITSE